MDDLGSTPLRRSLRGRLRRWIVVASLVTIALLTMAAVIEERRLLHEVETANARAFLAHLAEMTQLRADHAIAARYVAEFEGPLRGAGIRLVMVPADAPLEGAVLARRALELADGRFELRYASDAPWTVGLQRRAVAFHLVLGVAALAALLAGAEWILRRRLVIPLSRFAHQVRFMRDGGGWAPRLPSADSELGELARALEDLGPALHAQVDQWVEAERRAAAARAIGDLRAKLREPRRRALALLGDLQARDAVSPEAKPKLRALVAELERIGVEIRSEEAALFGPAHPRGTHR